MKTTSEILKANKIFKIMEVIVNCYTSSTVYSWNKIFPVFIP